eukprot:Tbor_TRINITY_DN5345_c0_g3::TRINITY_DN5345_c0_g3_i1::g.4334::m.4334
MDRTSIADIRDRDARLRSGTFPKKIGYFGHQPASVYYDRDRYESSIHANHHSTIPRKVKIGEDGKLHVINDPKREGIKINFKMDDSIGLSSRALPSGSRPLTMTSLGGLRTGTGTTSGVIPGRLACDTVVAAPRQPIDSHSTLMYPNLVLEMLSRPSTAHYLSTAPVDHVPGLTKKQPSVTQRTALTILNGSENSFSSYSKNGPYGEYLSSSEDNSLSAQRRVVSTTSKYKSPIPTCYERQCERTLINGEPWNTIMQRGDIHYGDKEDRNKPKRLPPFPRYPVLTKYC